MMRDIQILQQTLQNQCPSIHKKRLNSLILATKSMLDGSDLTLTKLGRQLETNTTVKHAIKRVDSLLGNRQLHREKDLIYRGCCKKISQDSEFSSVFSDRVTQ
ncbi:transposase (fragment) [Vibrio tapetis subsp. tapetis]|uniref:Transposase n=1 Tax=Vibrio tapetis subsp. tapetis TaxID=1671868 RepID=A0A2N8ZHU0_9VIBR